MQRNKTEKQDRQLKIDLRKKCQILRREREEREKRERRVKKSWGSHKRKGMD